MNPGARLNAITNEKVARFIGILLVFLMMVCGIMTIGNLIESLVPGPYAGIIAGIMLFVVVERLYTYRQTKSLTFLSKEWAISLGSQWLVIALLVRLVYAYSDGFDVFLRELALFARGNLDSLFTLEFLITMLFAFLGWVIPAQFMILLDEMGLDQELALRQISLPIQTDAIPARQRLINLTFSVGIILALLAALTRVDLRLTFGDTSGLPRLALNSLSGVEAGALLYFVFGLALLSLGRLMSLQTHWNHQRIPVSSHHLARQWGTYSVVFLLLLAAVVSLLPAGDSLGFFSVLRTLLSFLFGVLIFIGQWIVALVLLLFSLPFLLFRQKIPLMDNMPPPTSLTNLPQVAAAPAAPSEIWTMIRSILLWGSLIAIIIFAIVQFVRQHESILAAVRSSRIVNWLMLAWQWLYRNAGKTSESLRRTLADGWQRIVDRLEARRSLSRPGFLSLRSLDPRQRILFFYLAMVRRGNEQGLSRKPAQTPSEYAATLEKALPSAEQDIDAITDAFVEARYSRRTVPPEQADFVKELWARIRRALQSKPEDGE